MKHILCLSLLLCCLPSFSQNCKFDYDKEDKMTGKSIKRIDLKINFSHHLSFYNNGDILQITESITYLGEKNKFIEEGALLKIKLNNDSILELKSTNRAEPITSVTESSIRTRYIIEFNCEPIIFKTISKHGFSVFSIQPKGDIPQTYELKKKDAIKTAISAECIL